MRHRSARLFSLATLVIALCTTLGTHRARAQSETESAQSPSRSVPEAPVVDETPGATPDPPTGDVPAPAGEPAGAPVRRPSAPVVRNAPGASVRVPTFQPPARRDEPHRMLLPGLQGAWFYPPARGGRQRVLVYLHSRGANPREACRRWHESTPRFGWLLCPIGQGDRGNGRREWRNNAEYARRESIAALEALYAHYPRRVRRHDNVVMGFSEGAYVGMNVGLMEPVTFPRWFIIAANDGYIDGEESLVTRAARTVRRVYLLTGTGDEIVEHTRRASTQLTRAWSRRRVRTEIRRGMNHELPREFVAVTRPALLWVTQ